MNLTKNENTGFLFDINDSKLNVLLEESLEKNSLSVVGAEGKIDDFDLISKLYMVRHEFGDRNDFEVHEHYNDDGSNFTASVSFIKKTRKF